MTLLKDTTVYRGGSTAQSIPVETHDVDLTTLLKPQPWPQGGGVKGVLELRFSISAAGGGTTAIVVDLGEQDFEVLVTGMLERSASKVLPLMAAAVAQHMANLPKREATLRKEGREQVVYKAHEAWVKVQPGEGEIEALVHKRVAKFVMDLEPKPPVPVAAVKPPVVLGVVK